MRRRALMLAGLLATALLPLRVRAQAITAAPGGEMSSLKGVPFSVPIYVDMTQRTDKLGSFAARLSWNPAVLKFDGGSDGTFGNVTANEDSIANGVVHVAGANPAGAGGIVTLGVVTFTPLLAQADTLRFSVSELFAAGSFADLMPSLTVHDAYFCPARGMFGDIDRDGAINSRDALIALSNAVGLDVSAFDISLGDVDADGVTNARDALIVLSYAVSLPVSQYRVDRIAGGSCATNLPLVMSIVPSPLDLVVGQTAAFEARAADSAGTLKTVTDAIWKTSNGAVLAIFPDGKVQARGTGTAVVTAIRGTLDSAQATVSVVAHRTRHVVDAAAIGATNQLGSPAFPFATIGQGVAFAQPGDTVEVRVGRYPEPVTIPKAIVVMGDTLADGSRPVVVPDTAPPLAGIALVGSPVEVHNLAVDGYYEAVDLVGAMKVLLRGLRTTGTTFGVVVDSAALRVRIEDSRLTGAGAVYLSSGDGVSVASAVDTFVVRRTEISDFGGAGVSALFSDTVAILSSRIHDVGWSGVAAGAPRLICEICDVNPSYTFFTVSPSAVVLESTTVANAGNVAVMLNGIRSASFAHNHFFGTMNGAVEIVTSGSGWARFVGDSIDQPSSESYWLLVNGSGLDSLVMDSAWVHFTGYSSGNVYTVDSVRIANTQFADIQGQALYVGSAGNGVVTLDNVSVVGDPSCDLCADAFDFGSEKVIANRVTGVNLWQAIYTLGDSAVTVTNSQFRHVYQPITWTGTPLITSSRLTVTNTTFSGYYEAIDATGGAVVADSNTFQNGGYETFNLWGIAAPVVITRNRISGVPWAVELSASTTGPTFADTIADNVITDAEHGVNVDGSDTVSFAVLRNAVTCSAQAGSSGTGIQLYYANGSVSGNRVSGCYYGLDIYDDGSVPRVVSVLADTLSVPANAYQGILVSGSVSTRVAYNVVTGDTAGASVYGAVAVAGYPGTTGVVDSNTVTGGTTYGIYVADLDSALVRFNTVSGVKAPSSGQGGIVTDGGLSLLAVLRGNQVRGVLGNGIRVYNQNGLPDTAMVQVDSNLVDTSAAVGIELDGGADSVTRNRITRSGVAGVVINSLVDITRSKVTTNNIFGNRFGVQAYGLAYSALNNWWGDAAGPQCDTCAASTGDSISLLLQYNPWATTEFTTTPSAARVFVPLALQGPAIAPARAAASRDAPIARRERRTPPASSLVAQVPRPAATTPRPRPSGAQGRAWERREQLRAALVAASAQREAAMSDARRQAEAARALLDQRQEQHRADREARHAAKLAREAATRAAREAQRP